MATAVLNISAQDEFALWEDAYLIGFGHETARGYVKRALRTARALWGEDDNPIVGPALRVISVTLAELRGQVQEGPVQADLDAVAAAAERLRITITI